MTDTKAPSFALPTAALLEESEAHAEAIAAEQARQAAEREHLNLRQDRQTAVAHAKKILKIDTPPNAWERLEVDEDRVLARALVLPFDDPELRLAYRTRGYTSGGPLLTILALADDGETWIGARQEINRLADLAGVIADARRQAEAFDPDAWDEDPDYVEEAREDREPAVVIEAPNLPEALAEAVIRTVAAL